MKEIDIQHWLDKGREDIKKESKVIEFKGNKYNSPLYEDLSIALKKHGHIPKNVLRTLCENKQGGQFNSSKFDENSKEDIKEKTSKAIEKGENNLEEALDELTDLKQIAVATASKIMTVLFPRKYCLYDWRAASTLMWYKEPQEKNEFFKHIDLIRRKSKENFKNT